MSARYERGGRPALDRVTRGGARSKNRVTNNPFVLLLLSPPPPFAGLSNQLLTMQIFAGSNVYEVDASTTVEALMYQIENKEFIPVGSFALIGSAGTPLELDDLLGEDEQELELTLAVPAGMRAKWKKKRMRRLRRKRRKMRQRAR
jgi:hypothetical protein